jgi:CheY-like chemotaxis protein
MAHQIQVPAASFAGGGAGGGAGGVETGDSRGHEDEGDRSGGGEVGGKQTAGGAVTAAPSAGGALAPSPKRILVVDDNVDSADMLGEVLRGSGHEVVVANDPAAALRLLGTFSPEIAILDIGLPVMDGYELAERIHATAAASGCRLIALTGYGQQYDRARSVRTGFASHLVKPVDLDALEHIIEAL